ncbi:MAG: membrane protein insertase YidC [Bacteroidales bacterium]|nr:membrane protein insertase YidC [Bacteroidales bacterium]
MDRNSIIGIVIIGVILVLYSVFNRPDKAQLMEQKRVQDSIATVKAKEDSLKEVEKAIAAEKETQETDSLLEQEALLSENNDSINNVQLKEKLGVFAHAAQGEQSFITIENNLIKLKISSKGGRVYQAELKEYKDHNGKPVVLINTDTTVFGIEFMIDGRPIFTNDLFFESVENVEFIDANESEETLTMRLKAGENSYLDFVYTLKPDEYMLDFDIRFYNMQDIISRNVNYGKLYWAELVKAQEKGRKWELQNTNVYLKMDDDDIEKLSERKSEDEFTSSGKMHWVAFKQQFFSSVLIADELVDDPLITSNTIDDENSEFLKYFTAECTFPIKNEQEQIIPFQFYFGPNKFKTLKQYDIKLEKLIPLGWGIFGWVNRFLIIPLFNWLGTFIGSYGIIILILTIIIKMLLFPLTYKSYMSTAKMKVLKPQIDEIAKKFPKGKEMEKQQATMALYKKAGVNPMGGCLPMLLQFPILIAMFRFFPASIELRQESFLWASDLSAYDAIVSWNANIPLLSNFYGNHISLFTLLMAISMFVSTKMSSSSQASTGQPGMKVMLYMMPVMMLFFFNNYASGLSYYYFLANLFTIIQTWVIRKYFVDEDKVLAKLEENKKKPVKKSNWQKRLEEASRQKSNQQRRR